MRHGQLSLETIIQFVIIAVVVATIINLIFNTVSTDSPDIAGETRSLGQIQSSCESKCTDWAYAAERDKPSEALDYCIARYASDRNDNGRVDTVEQGFNSYCEDGIHCFNVHTCSDEGQTLDINTCIDLMCQRYMEQGMPAESASTNISEIFELDTAKGNRGAGTCDLNSLEGPSGSDVTTWWSDNFAPKGSNPSDLCDGVAP